MKYLILLLALNACTTSRIEIMKDFRAKETKFSLDEHYTYFEGECDQAALDAYSAKIGAYEITCEEMEEL